MMFAAKFGQGNFRVYCEIIQKPRNYDFEKKKLSKRAKSSVQVGKFLALYEEMCKR